MAECKMNSSSSSEPDSMIDSINVNATSLSTDSQTTVPHKNRIDDNHKLWVPIANINEYITCGICKGYLYEAATITECMHSFCKSCIVRHLERSLQCPTCQILIHPTDPFVHIRLDRLLQDIVYGLLPAVAEEELLKEKKFYAENDTKLLPPVQRAGWGPAPAHYSSSSHDPNGKSAPLVSLSLQCKCSSPLEKRLDKKFVRVTGEATVNNVELFLRKKLVLAEDHVVELYCCCAEGCVSLEPSHTLSTVKEQYFKQEDFLHLEYKVSPKQWLD